MTEALLKSLPEASRAWRRHRRAVIGHRDSARRLVGSRRAVFEWIFSEMVLYLDRLKHLMPNFKHGGPNQGKAVGILHAWLNLNKGNQAMTKSLEAISETVRNPKHPFRKIDNQPKKTLKHRYERRKIKSYLQLGDWVANEAT